MASGSKVASVGVTTTLSDDAIKKSAGDSPPYSFKDRLYSLYLYYRLGSQVKQPNQVLYIDLAASQEAGTVVSKTMSCDQMNSVPKPEGKTRLVAVSDTHEKHHLLTIPRCDILVHTGDILFVGRKQSEALQLYKYRNFNKWLGNTPSTHRIVVGGNHDGCLAALENKGEEYLKEVFNNGTIVLHNRHITLEGLRIAGTPYSSGRSRNRAYQGEEDRDRAISSLRDTKVDLFLSHSNCLVPEDLGIQPRLHVWGHHHAYGGLSGVRLIPQALEGSSGGSRSFLSVCATIMNPKYQPHHLPVVVDL